MLDTTMPPARQDGHDNLFGWRDWPPDQSLDKYPNAPGFKAPGPSQEAAEAIKSVVKGLRADVLAAIEAHAPCTADAVAAILRRSILSIRPRVSELHKLGVIEPTGHRAANNSGMTASLWKPANERGQL